MEESLVTLALAEEDVIERGMKEMLKAGVIKKAIEEAEEGEHYLYGIGAVIFKGSRIFGSGHNSFRGSKVPVKYKRFPHTLHAEQSAIYNVINWDSVRGGSLLVIRINKRSGSLSKSYPCEYCLDSIKHVGIKNIFYSNRKGEIIRVRLSKEG